MKRAEYPGRFVALFCLILATSCSPNDQARNQDSLDQALISAVSKGNASEVEQLLKRGASPDARETKVTKPDAQANQPGGIAYAGDSALMLAIRSGFDGIVKLLVSKGANVNLAGEAGFTPLITAGQKRNAAMATFLLSKGAKPNQQNVHGDTAIVFAANAGDVPTVKALLDGKADINGGTGWTPLMQAAYQWHTDLVKFLLERGADPNFTRPPYMSPLECAEAQHADDIATILIAAGAKAQSKETQEESRNDQIAKWDKEREDARLVKATKYAGLGKLTNDDRAVIVAFVDDLCANGDREFLRADEKNRRLILLDETSGDMNESQEGQINSELEGSKAAQVTLDMRRNMLNRNFQPVSLAGLKFSDPNVVLKKEGDVLNGKMDFWGDRPPGKGWVQIYLPGLNVARDRAVVRFHFGPSAHGAAGTFLLVKTKGVWTVAWRDFAHYA